MPVEPDTCHHCGDPCRTKPHRLGELPFCCRGCLTVYQLLSEHGLDHFYADGTAPGNRVEQGGPDERYAYLDTVEIQDLLLLFKDDRQSKVRLHLPAIHCSSCLWLLEHLHRLNEGIIAVQVDFSRREALISFAQDRISLRQLAELLHGIGYPPHIDLKAADSEVAGRSDTSLLLRIGITGFLFGNIMLLSFPDYFSTDADSIEDFSGFFSYLILGLSLPVLLYGARDFFRSSFAALKHARLTIDVPIAIGISVIFLRSVYDILMGIGPGYLDSMAGLVFFLLIGRWYQGRVYDSLSFERDFRSFFPLSVERLTPDGRENVPVMDLEENDRIAILGQGIIPADCQLQSETISIDYSFVTGESRPVVVGCGESVYAGGRNLSGRVELKVSKKVSQSYLTDLWNQEAFSKKTPALSGLLDRMSGRFTLAVLGIALLTAIYWLLTDSRIMMDAVTAVLIVACPCALALSVPFALGNVRRLLSAHGLFTKNTQTIEKMATIDTIVFDKTGTLTSTKDTSCSYHGESLTASEIDAVSSLAAQSAHPHCRMIQELLNGQVDHVGHYSEVEGRGIEGIVDGHQLKIGSAGFLGLAENEATGSVSHLLIDGHLKGRYVMSRELRAEVGSTIRALRNDFRLILLSGDNPAEAELFAPLFHPSEMHFDQRPKEKLEFIRQLQSDGHGVMMVGDGLNDAGALKQADVGIAIADDMSQFTPACDAILEANGLPRMSEFFRYSTFGLKAVRWSVVFSLLYNLVGITFAVQGLLTPLIAAILMPLSSVTVIGFATLITGRKAGVVFDGNVEMDFNDGHGDQRVLKGTGSESKNEQLLNRKKGWPTDSEEPFLEEIKLADIDR